MQIKATRMELLKLKKRTKIAKRGHELLKDKRDELMRRFLSITSEVKLQREETESILSSAYSKVLDALSLENYSQLESALIPGVDCRVDILTKNVVGVELVEIKHKLEDRHGYSLISIPESMDGAIQEFRSLLPELIHLIEMEDGIEKLARELQLTRRRVNALEYRTIPEMERQIKYIQMKLDEMERSNITNLLKIKDVITIG